MKPVPRPRNPWPPPPPLSGLAKQSGGIVGICELCDRQDDLRRVRPPEADVELHVCLSCAFAMPEGWTWWYYSGWYEYLRLPAPKKRRRFFQFDGPR